MKKILVSLLALLNLFHSSTPCFANDNHSEYPNTNELEISTTSDEFYDMKSDGLIPDEVISYIERTERNNPQAEISIIVSTSENNRSLSSYTNYRTYGNYELADMLVHVSNAHNMQNVLSGSSSGDFYSTMAFAAAVNSIAYVYPFYSYAVTASQFILGTTAYTASTGDKLNAAPAYSTYCKFTFVKWNGSWTLGVQSYYATLTTISWYLYLQSTNTQYTGVGSYNISRASNYYINPDYTAVQYYQSGGLIESRPKITIGNASFYLY